MQDAMKPLEAGQRINNSLFDLVAGLSPCDPFGAGGMFGQTISQPWTLRKDATAGLLTLDWVTLSNSYAHIGLVQTLIDQPVEDALRGGFKIETNGQLDEEDVAELMRAMDDGGEDGDLQQVMQTAKWGRLFGGGGLLLDDGSDPSDDFKPEDVKQGQPLFFVSADRWELLPSFISLSGFQPIGQDGRAITGDHTFSVNTYAYYSVTGINPERVKRVMGVPAPKYIRQQLQGWGMSELERCLREINSFLKFQDLLFELIDEAKIDVHKIEGFNEMLATQKGTEMVQKRVQLANMLKNYKNALVMDKDDDYMQKQLGTVFNGLAAIYEELRMNLSAALKIPMGKLFGTSASGLNASGEDAIENYNALVETVRKKLEPLLKWVISIRCQQLFGFVPDFTIQFPSLRVMTAEDEEKVKTSKQKRATDLFSLGVMSVPALEETLTKDGLLSVKLEKSPEFRDQQLSAGKPKPEDKAKPAKADKRKDNAIVTSLECIRVKWRAAA